MGLLTSNAAVHQKAKLAKILIKGNTLICFVLYAAGLAYFWMLAHKEFNHSTYFSENALLPGLVYSEINSDTINYALQLQEELRHERDTHRSSTPHAWLQAKMRQIGLDTFTHNFTLNYPLGGGKVFTGKNVYGILRAPRIGSTESFVITAPYRPPDAMHPEIMHSVPLMLAFASHARKQKYWAKDLIFLVTEQEQLGMQAWLEAYKGTNEPKDDHPILNAGTLDDRAGAIQAAINLELHAFDTEYVDIKIEGLNGQLPNLDLVNLVRRISMKEGLACGHQQTSKKNRAGSKSSQTRNFRHMVTMLLAQASGVPNGNHGLFHRYGIEALTIEAHRTESTNSQRKSAGAGAQLRLLEGVSRSINNLLERFHQSFFFYIMVASDRFVSIGDYMPCLALMVGALLVKALSVWLTVGDSSVNKVGKEDFETHVEDEKDHSLDYNFIGVIKVLFLVHAIGIFSTYLPTFQPLNQYAYASGWKTEQFIFALFTSLSLGTMVLPFMLSLSFVTIEILHIAALVEMGTSLLVVGMLNFSFAFILSVLVVPLVIMIQPTQHGRLIKSLRTVAVLLINPLAIVYFVLVAVTALNFEQPTLVDIAKRAFTATADAITFSVIDSMIYGNWLFSVIVIIFLPIWSCLWIVALCQQKTESYKLKSN